MVVLLEVTVDAVHAALEVDVLEMNGLSIPPFDLRPACVWVPRASAPGTLVGVVHRIGQLLRRRILNDVAGRVEQVALAVSLHDRAKQPSVPMEIGETRLRERVVEVPLGIAGALQELAIAPQSTHGTPLRVA